MKLFSYLKLLAVTAAVAIPAAASAHDGYHDSGRPGYGDRAYIERGYDHRDYGWREQQRREFLQREAFRREMMRRERLWREVHGARYDYRHNDWHDGRHDDRRPW
jgi:hypothetical protein